MRIQLTTQRHSLRHYRRARGIVIKCRLLLPQGRHHGRGYLVSSRGAGANDERCCLLVVIINHLTLLLTALATSRNPRPLPPHTSFLLRPRNCLRSHFEWLLLLQIILQNLHPLRHLLRLLPSLLKMPPQVLLFLLRGLCQVVGVAPLVHNLINFIIIHLLSRLIEFFQRVVSLIRNRVFIEGLPLHKPSQIIHLLVAPIHQLLLQDDHITPLLLLLLRQVPRRRRHLGSPLLEVVCPLGVLDAPVEDVRVAGDGLLPPPLP